MGDLFKNIRERVALREAFRREKGMNWENSQCEPDIDYVVWLEDKVIGLIEEK